jgi:hypothetical protein
VKDFFVPLQRGMLDEKVGDQTQTVPLWGGVVGACSSLTIWAPSGERYPRAPTTRPWRPNPSNVSFGGTEDRRTKCRSLPRRFGVAVPNAKLGSQFPQEAAVTDIDPLASTKISSAPEGDVIAPRPLRRFSAISISLLVALVLACGGVGVLAGLYASQSASLTASHKQLASLKGAISSDQAKISDLQGQISTNAPILAAATQADAKIATLTTQLAACRQAATDYGAQAIANAVIASNPFGNNTINLHVASTEQAAGNASGCLTSP